MNDSPYQDERLVAAELALRAGAAVLAACREKPRVSYKKGGEPVTEADLISNRIILQGLRERFAEDQVLSEESADDPGRLGHHRVWIVDPVDGTQDLINETGQYAVMIGLAVDGDPVVGVVFQPARQRLWQAEVGGCALVTVASSPPQPIRVSDRRVGQGIRLVLTRTHPFVGMKELMERQGIESVTTMGSVGLKVAAVASGDADLYLHISRITQEWDTCAPDALLRAAGGLLTDLAGKPLTYNKPHLRNERGVLASNGLIHQWAREQVHPFAVQAGLLPRDGEPTAEDR